MPFGPAPAPPEMQSFAARTFGEIRDRKTGDKVCVPLMDDLPISRWTLRDHIRHVNQVLETAGLHHFEFKLVKGQFNQKEIVLWGCIYDKHGRRPKEKQVKQLISWPAPKNEDDVKSFLAFVN